MDKCDKPIEKPLPPAHPKKLKVLTTAAIFLGNISLVKYSISMYAVVISPHISG